MVIARMNLGYKMRVDLRSRTEVFAYYTGDYDTSLIAAACRLLPPGGVALDVGANVGFWAVAMARHGQVYAYEPVPSNADRIRENASLNLVTDNLMVRGVGLSDKPGTLRLSLREDFSRGSGTGNAAVVIDQDDEAFSIINIPTSTLDYEAVALGLQRVDVLKMDIEGHEDAALRGGSALLREFRPVIFMEWNTEYYRRRGIDPTEALTTETHGLDYVCLRWEGVQWVTGPIDSPLDIDDLVLAPREQLAGVVAALSG